MTSGGCGQQTCGSQGISLDLRHQLILQAPRLRDLDPNKTSRCICQLASGAARGSGVPEGRGFINGRGI